MKTLIFGGRVIDPANRVDAKLNLLIEDGKIAWVVITQKDKLALGIEEEHLETAIDMVRSREGVEIALAIREAPGGSFRASMRSNGFDVASVAAVFGGGGHMRAAGCTVPALSADEALEAVLGEIQRQL